MTSITCFEPTLITGHSFAQYWLKDALKESKEGQDYNAVRREIIFACCFLESYLLEWAESQLVSDVDALLGLFPAGKKLPTLRKKWEITPQVVYDKKGLGTFPSMNFTDFRELVSLRNNLMHSQSSHLSISNVTKKSGPNPSIEQLEEKGNAWAIQVAIDMVKDLHKKCGTDLPRYFDEATS